MLSQGQAFALTQAVEVPTALLLVWLLARDARLLLVAGAAIVASVLTHPGAWAVNEGLRGIVPFAPRAAVIEVAVALAETVVYRLVAGLAWRVAAAASFVANAASFFIGLAVMSALAD
jgi:hypothetical protein